MKPRSMTAVVDRKRYSTKTSTVIASNAYWDGNNWERSGRNTYLYRTKNNNYFACYLTCWQGERDSIQPLTEDEAIDLWESLPEKETDFEEAFPGVTVEEA